VFIGTHSSRLKSQIMPTIDEQLFTLLVFWSLLQSMHSIGNDRANQEQSNKRRFFGEKG